MPLIEGRGGWVFVPEGLGTSTRSDRQSPSPCTTLEEPLHVVETQLPPRRICVELEHAKQLLGPAPEQLEQLESHDWQDEEVLSKYWDLLQVGRQRPLVSTGRSEGQLEHWLNDCPLHVAQSGWHVIHEPDELNVFDGQDETHLPLEASWLLAHVKQNVEEPAHVLQDESHATYSGQDL